ncbi:3-phenylpropionate/cinnamic acid dioxygenase subunit beta [Myxococcus virescens]|uniref:Benzene/toluene dioxygenase beta subunit n=1 Tax=Myxococcus virescens TaxID=83456 RepID=A0A511HBN9_9BACT|nr:3-phenylpropionate/cinnamic acid dioxygenase subunit beta [Myxococcus virescens]GEL70885.1 hypothetical biphenyl dioxygenase beta subunit [Myxococcus virescens]SDE21380.1 benzene/toluene dioxygenase beta subunit [Myxococcus virescens]
MSPHLEAMLLQHEIEQFYYMEAALLDERRFNEWLALLTKDLEYWMPVRSTRTRADMHLEFSKPGEAAYFDDDKQTMTARVKKLDTGFSWAEDPPSRTRHLVSNVRITGRSGEGELEVSSNFHVYRSRLANDEDSWFGRREDCLRKLDDSWQVSRRHIYLDQVSLDSQNLSIFF